MAEQRRKPPGQPHRIAFPNMIITIAVMPAMTRPVKQAKRKMRISRRR
jgi:hypothetical protein